MAIIKKYKVVVKQVLNPLPDIYRISFTSEKMFKYLPGQFLHLALDEYDGIGQWPESRCFSMQSSPAEPVIIITFSVKGRFTERMAEELKIGKEVWLKLPYGDLFDRDQNKDNCVFIAGGTGITPFLSLFTDNSFSEYVNPVLYSGFRNISYNIFNKELTFAQNINNKFEINTIYEDRNGMLDIKYIHNNHGVATYFISGPPLMINNFKNYLLEKNINGSNIITDDWE